jgi:UDP-N-acetylmuramyl pentapeptide phosphotransferase/UDP-N-acetylglucosamine-1-phosphate transferase
VFVEKLYSSSAQKMLRNRSRKKIKTQKKLLIATGYQAAALHFACCLCSHWHGSLTDGFNGLASTMSTLAFIGIALIAWQVSDVQLSAVAIILAACIWDSSGLTGH